MACLAFKFKLDKNQKQIFFWKKNPPKFSSVSFQKCPFLRIRSKLVIVDFFFCFFFYNYISLLECPSKIYWNDFFEWTNEMTQFIENLHIQSGNDNYHFFIKKTMFFLFHQLRIHLFDWLAIGNHTSID